MQNMGCCCGLKQKGGGSASHSERAASDSKLGPLSYTVLPFAFWLPPVKHRWAKDVLRALSLSLGDADNRKDVLIKKKKTFSRPRPFPGLGKLVGSLCEIQPLRTNQ